MQAFSRVLIDHLVQGGTRVSWELNRHFIDPLPYEFQLQFSHTGLENADDWIDIGASVMDTYFALDLDKHLFGKTLDAYYRVKLSTSLDTYYSTPQSVSGLLSKRDWLIAREIVRKEVLRHSRLSSPKGFLLKVRRYGPPCPDCLDYLTDEVNNSQCLTCFSTGFLYGYFEPLPAYYVDISLAESREHRAPQVGMESKDVRHARFIGDPLVYSYDVWINEFSDERFYLHTVKEVANIRGVTLVYDAELRLAPFTDVIYKFELDKDEIPNPPGPTIWKNRDLQRGEITYLEAQIRKLKRK